MKIYEFDCSGDHGSWECTVDVELTEEEEKNMIEFVSAHHPRRLNENDLPDIYSKVIDGLQDQCDEDLDLCSVIIHYPSDCFDLSGENE